VPTKGGYYIASTETGIVRRRTRDDSPNYYAVIVSVINDNAELFQWVHFHILILGREYRWFNDNGLFPAVTQDDYRHAIGVAV